MAVFVTARYEKTGDRYIRLRLSDGRVIYEHRFVVETQLGRSLLSTEIVHHIDHDARNNDFSNLSITNRSKHSKLHADRANKVSLTCPACHATFVRSPNYVRSKTRQKQLNFFCCRSCRVSNQVVTGDTASFFKHGTLNGYRNRKCRCFDCCKAQRDWMREYQAKKRRSKCD